LPSTADLYAAFASRFAAVIPYGFSITAIDNGLRVSCGNDAAWFGGGDLHAADQPLADALEEGAWQVLNDVQDYVIVTIRDAWPKTSTGQVAMPGARVVGGQLHL